MKLRLCVSIMPNAASSGVAEQKQLPVSDHWQRTQ